MLEDWRAENKLLPKERRLKIEIWQREGISSPPDFKIHKFNGIKDLCWIDVKWTSNIDNPFNLNWNKYTIYVRVSEKTHLPVYIVVFTGEPCEDNPRAWVILIQTRRKESLLRTYVLLLMKLKEICNNGIITYQLT